MVTPASRPFVQFVERVVSPVRFRSFPIRLPICTSSRRKPVLTGKLATRHGRSYRAAAVVLTDIFSRHRMAKGLLISHRCDAPNLNVTGMKLKNSHRSGGFGMVDAVFAMG